jgi:hypothetical protein
MIPKTFWYSIKFLEVMMRKVKVLATKEIQELHDIDAKEMVYSGLAVYVDQLPEPENVDKIKKKLALVQSGKDIPVDEEKIKAFVAENDDSEDESDNQEEAPKDEKPVRRALRRTAKQSNDGD